MKLEHGIQLKIAIAGPYSAPTAKQRQANLDRLNQAAVAVLHKGHIPMIGVNAALAVVNAARFDDSPNQHNSVEKNDAIMLISMALVDGCDALLHLGDSPGANRERDLIAAKGLPIFRAIEEIPLRLTK